jgi:hypothetical protein
MVKQQESEANHLISPYTKVMNAWAYTTTLTCPFLIKRKRTLFLPNPDIFFIYLFSTEILCDFYVSVGITFSIFKVEMKSLDED